MAELTIKLSDKALSLIAQLQKEIFNRRRKKVVPAGVVETLVESAAKSQSDKRFATSWKNLIADIEKAAKLADEHGSKPSSLSDEEWAMVLSHRARPAKKAPAKRTATKAAVAKTTSKRAPAKKAPAKVSRQASAGAANKKTAAPAAKKARGGSVAKRMAKAASKLTTAPVVSSAPVAAAEPFSN